MVMENLWQEIQRGSRCFYRYPASGAECPTVRRAAACWRDTFTSGTVGRLQGYVGEVQRGFGS